MIDSESESVFVEVAFVTVNYNTRHYVEAILSFFEGCNLPFSYRLVVVDNGSTDGSHELLQHNACVVYLPQYMNCGYGAAINRGLAATDSRYAVVMNTDIELTEYALVRLWTFMESNADAAWAAPRIVYPNGRQQGFVFHPSLLSLYWIRKNALTSTWYKLKAYVASCPFQVPGLMGAFFWLRLSSVPDAVKGNLFDERYFFYYEDADLAFRMCRKGAKAFVVPDASIIHYGGGSTSSNARSHFLRNKLQFIAQHYGRNHASIIRSLDKIRVWRKYYFYRLIAKVMHREQLVRRAEKYRVELAFYRESNEQ